MGAVGMVWFGEVNFVEGKLVRGPVADGVPWGLRGCGERGKVRMGGGGLGRAAFPSWRECIFRVRHSIEDDNHP